MGVPFTRSPSCYTYSVCRIGRERHHCSCRHTVVVGAGYSRRRREKAVRNRRTQAPPAEGPGDIRCSLAGEVDSTAEVGTAQAAERRMMRYNSDPDIQT
jgi:hypothetical protein